MSVVIAIELSTNVFRIFGLYNAWSNSLSFVADLVFESKNFLSSFPEPLLVLSFHDKMNHKNLSEENKMDLVACIEFNYPGRAFSER